MPLLHLLTFGGLSLQIRGITVTGAVTQRRRIALMSLLAVAGPRGMSRDRILAMLWPEDQLEKARHVLNQLLYAQRRELQSEDLFLGNKTLRLNPEVLTSDVGDFLAALGSGDGPRALELYEGRFLEGFHLPDTPAFDYWADAERSRLSGMAATAAENLATRATRAGDLPAAIGWWRSAARADPYSARYATALLSA